MTQETTLTLGGIQLPADQDPLGVWELSGRETVAFAAGSSFEGPVWRVELPPRSRAARAQLRAQREQVRRRDRALDQIAARLTHIDLGSSYETTGDVHETELLTALTALTSPTASFDTRADEWLQYRAIYEQAEALLAQFRVLVRPVARVETVIGSQLVGLTVIDWNGDYETTWMEGSAPEQMEVHVAAVRLAMASRQALLRLFVVVVTGALGLAVQAHIPGGQILLVPAVYRFVRDVLQELKHLSDGVRIR
jgi:hypothetical protein